MNFNFVYPDFLFLILLLTLSIVLYFTLSFGKFIIAIVILLLTYHFSPNIKDIVISQILTIKMRNSSVDYQKSNQKSEILKSQLENFAKNLNKSSK
jgi:hypothetical protein